MESTSIQFTAMHPPIHHASAHQAVKRMPSGCRSLRLLLLRLSFVPPPREKAPEPLPDP
jgi:hypothetical protein